MLKGNFGGSYATGNSKDFIFGGSVLSENTLLILLVTKRGWSSNWTEDNTTLPKVYQTTEAEINGFKAKAIMCCDFGILMC